MNIILFTVDFFTIFFLRFDTTAIKDQSPMAARFRIAGGFNRTYRRIIGSSITERTDRILMTSNEASRIIR